MGLQKLERAGSIRNFVLNSRIAKPTDIMMTRVVETQQIIVRGSVGLEHSAEMKPRPVEVRPERISIDWFMKQNQEELQMIRRVS